MMPLYRPVRLSATSLSLARTVGTRSLFSIGKYIRIGRRPLDEQEKDKVRGARAIYFSGQKREKSSFEGENSSLNTTTNDPDNMSSNKRFKFSRLGFSKTRDSKDETPLIVAFYDPSMKSKDPRGRTLEDILSWPDMELESCHNYIQMLFPVPEGSVFNWEAPIIDRQVMDEFRAREELRSQLRRSFERMVDFYGFAVETQAEVLEEDKVGNNGAEEAEAQPSNGVEESSDARAGAEQKAQDEKELPPEPTPENTESTTAIKPDSPAEASTSPQPTGPSPTTTYMIIRGPKWSRNSRNWAVRFDHNHLRITRIIRCLRVLGLQTECDAFFAALKDVFDDEKYRISERSMMYWHRAITKPLYIAPDDDRIGWLMEWEVEQQEKKAKEGEDRIDGTKVEGDEH